MEDLVTKHQKVGIEISLYSTVIMAVFTPANRDKEGYFGITSFFYQPHICMHYSLSPC